MSVLEILGLCAFAVVGAGLIGWWELKRGRSWQYVVVSAIFSNLFAFAIMLAWSYWK